MYIYIVFTELLNLNRVKLKSMHNSMMSEIKTTASIYFNSDILMQMIKCPLRGLFT